MLCKGMKEKRKRLSPVYLSLILKTDWARMAPENPASNESQLQKFYQFWDYAKDERRRANQP